jgi:homoserine dehydrogenase
VSAAGHGRTAASAVRIGMIGLGTVGAGTFEVLGRNQEEIQRRAGRPIHITQVAVRDLARARKQVAGRARVVSDAKALVADPEIDVVVELIGGTDTARELVLAALAHGKHVVTANKALLAVHGKEIFDRAAERNLIVAFEAAVAGIKTLREGLAGNRIDWIAGIINGTTNFILTEMRDKGLAFADVLREAQRLGYAEAEPSTDIDGIDAAHKITILASIAFGIPVSFRQAHIEGIGRLAQEDIRYAEQLGYRIKLLGITRRRPEGVELRVHPTLVPARRLIANVEGAMNAVWVKGDAVGQTMLYGKGAGAEPTASAVIADLVEVARLLSSDPEHRVPVLAFQPGALSNAPILPIGMVDTACYLRMRVADQPGVLADITRILADGAISIDAMLQREPAEGEAQTDIIILTHVAREANVDHAIERIEALATVLSAVTRIRLEHFN